VTRRAANVRRGARTTFAELPAAAPIVAAVVLLAALPLASCGEVISPDLFVVERSGGGPGVPLSLVVSEEGVAHCNRGPGYRLSDPAVIQARTIQEELHTAATHHLALPARAGSVFGYRVRDPEGSVSFADNSAGQPKVLRQLQLFVLQVAQGVCHLRV
jgi:hypothetical protein